jgi:hypothetical protein
MAGDLTFPACVFDPRHEGVVRGGVMSHFRRPRCPTPGLTRRRKPLAFVEFVPNCGVESRISRTFPGAKEELKPLQRMSLTEAVRPRPASVKLANAFGSGRSFLFDVRNPHAPRLLHAFGDVGPYSHAHSYERLPNGHTLTTFQ